MFKHILVLVDALACCKNWANFQHGQEKGFAEEAVLQPCYPTWIRRESEWALVSWLVWITSSMAQCPHTSSTPHSPFFHSPAVTMVTSLLVVSGSLNVHDRQHSVWEKDCFLSPTFTMCPMHSVRGFSFLTSWLIPLTHLILSFNLVLTSCWLATGTLAN